MEPQKSFFARNKTWIIILGILVLLVLWGVQKYNYFIRQNEAVSGQWAQVENVLQRRFDLIPNLVETVKGVVKQEQTVFGQIAEARSHYAGATTPDQKAVAATEVESALARLLVITENYPTLQSSQAFRDLMTSLEGTENRIAVERMKYNDLVRDFDANVKVFPSSIFAKIFGIEAREYFQVPETAQQNPQVKF